MAEDVNEHLQTLNLQKLSDTEFQSLDQFSLPLLSAPPDVSGGEADEQDGNDDEHYQEQNSKTNSSIRQTLRTIFAVPSIGFEPLAALGLASNVLQMADFAAKLAIAATNISREVREAASEFAVFSRRVSQYSQLLLVVAENTIDIMPAGSILNLTNEILSDTFKALRETEAVIMRYHDKKTGFSIRRIAEGFHGGSDKKTILAVLDEIESLKANLSIVLQTFQIQAQNKPGRETSFTTDTLSLKK